MPYVEWQSTLAYLKNPPSGYWRQPHDVLGGLQDMIDNIDRYDSQYRFEVDLYMRYALAYDGHFSYTPYLLFNVFGFGRPWTLVSVSSDGFEPPRVYIYDEVIDQVANSQRLPSHITGIDGHDVEHVMAQTAEWAVSHDLDAAYNQLFYSLAQGSQGFQGNGAGIWAGGGRGQTIYNGDWTSITFANGTTRVAQTYASAFSPMLNITTGADIYRQSILPFTEEYNVTSPGAAEALALNSVVASDGRAEQDSPGPAGYPNPVAKIGGFAVSGYFLTDHVDTAVLGIQSFGSPYLAPDIQSTVDGFLKQAKAEGKTRLIIDLSANGGGHIPQA
jgi:hypothetical protein